jgi:dihydrodipicolinate synthase/N-acetylneuraminate lyase
MCITIAHASPKTPFMFYYFPAMNGIVVPVIDTLKLANEYAPNVVGVKFTDAKYSDARLISDAGFNVCVGAAEVFNSALASGAHGLIGTMNNWSGSLHGKIYSNFQDPTTRHLADRYAAHSCVMAKAIEQTGNVFSGRAYMFEKISGISLGAYRYPLHNLDDAHRKKLDEFIARFDLDPTFE